MKNKFIAQLKLLYKEKQLDVYKKNEIIYFEQQPCEYVSIIVSGSIYMSSFYKDNEIKYNYMHKNDIFGHNLVFNENNLYKGNIYALENTKILNLTKAEFAKSLQNPDILNYYLSFLSNQTLIDKEELKLLRITKMEDRIIYYLSIHNNKITFKSIIALSIKLNVTREALTRVLNKLESEGIITRTDKTITLNK